MEILLIVGVFAIMYIKANMEKQKELEKDWHRAYLNQQYAENELRKIKQLTKHTEE